MKYLRRHWRGEQSLAWSFWVNLVALRLLVFSVQHWAENADLMAPQLSPAWVVIWVTLCHLGLLTWQVVGVLRAADRDFTERGTMALVWAVQLVCVMLFIHTALSVFAVSLLIRAPSVDQVRWNNMVQARQSQYQLIEGEGGQTLLIDGVIELGMARRVKDILEVQPRLREIQLHSEGGNIYEARALAGLFGRYSMNTQVEKLCASACTTAFIGGSVRSVSPQARLGFHQYRVDASYIIIATNTEKEQARDANFYQSAGISADFVKLVFSHPSGSMWWPSHDELIAAGVVHHVR